MTKPVLLVGEHNPLSTNRRLALYDEPVNCSGHRLRTKILGLSRTTYFGPLIHRTNLCIAPYSESTAHEVADALLRSQRRECAYSVIITLGQKVRRAFDVQVEFFRSVKLGRMTLIALPHPSGRSREWNGPISAYVARCLLRDFAPHVPWGEIL